ncbi:hypothetical protein [Streptomyces sp. NPDC059455]|uniref:hypothetical protein n=1 Tax=Streptomyces sp. NPDC059455 TaxID=3346837 RepID=UPI0036BA6AEF
MLTAPVPTGPYGSPSQGPNGRPRGAAGRRRADLGFAHGTEVSENAEDTIFRVALVFALLRGCGKHRQPAMWPW